MPSSSEISAFSFLSGHFFPLINLFYNESYNHQPYVVICNILSLVCNFQRPKLKYLSNIFEDRHFTITQEKNYILLCDYLVLIFNL